MAWAAAPSKQGTLSFENIHPRRAIGVGRDPDLPRLLATSSVKLFVEMPNDMYLPIASSTSIRLYQFQCLFSTAVCSSVHIYETRKITLPTRSSCDVVCFLDTFGVTAAHNKDPPPVERVTVIVTPQ